MPAIGNAALTRMAAGAGSGRSAASFALRLGVGNAAVARLLQRDELPPGGVPGGGMPGGTPDPQAADEALRLNGLDMPGLLAGLDSKGRDWVSNNRVPLVHTPGVGPQRMAIAVEAVMSGREASDERLAVMMGEMQAMGLPDDQQEVVARSAGAFGLRAPAILDRYVAGAAALKAEWATLKGPTARGAWASSPPRASRRPGSEAARDQGRADRGGRPVGSRGLGVIVADRIGNLRDEPEMFARAAATVYHEARPASRTSRSCARSPAGSARTRARLPLHGAGGDRRRGDREPHRSRRPAGAQGRRLAGRQRRRGDPVRGSAPTSGRPRHWAHGRLTGCAAAPRPIARRSCATRRSARRSGCAA